LTKDFSTQKLLLIKSMNNNIVHIIYLAMAYLVLFVSSEVLYHKFRFKAEFTRKYVHIATGVLSLLFPLLFDNHLFVLGLTFSFLIILLLSVKYDFLKSINEISRVSRGSILYPIIVYVTYLVYHNYNQMIFYYIPILILAICDPIAAFIGKIWTKFSYKTFGQTKTLTGSIGFFIVAIVVGLLLMLNLESIGIVKAIVIALVIALTTTIAEALTHKGYDNIAIPLTAIMVLILFKKLNYI